MTPSDTADDDRQLSGRWYANSFQVGHNAFEFKLDCGQDDSSGEKVTVYFRVITSPFSARELFRLLGVGLLRYADSYGPIDSHGRSDAKRSGS